MLWRCAHAASFVDWPLEFAETSTSLRIALQYGELGGNGGGRTEVDVSVQHSVASTTKSEASLPSVMHGMRSSVMIGKGWKRSQTSWRLSGIHSICIDPKKDKWDRDVSDDMKNFELALFDKKGFWK